MSPAANELHERLERLRQRLHSEAGIDADLRASLLGLLDEVQQLQTTASSTTKPTHNAAPTLAGRVAQAAEDFEHSHPVLAETIGNVADVLSRMGI
ncbi:MAG: DUF4404 family protein [Planctomycetaceae bacterium]|nr:DUF4404 family protein [Planctomycetaceae bacterium]